MTMQVSSSTLDESQVRWIVTQATRAPSVHNTQPWRFRWDGQAFEVIADLRRGLVISDPQGRELAMSCGAALFNLRLALRHLGLQGTAELLPDHEDSHVLARVGVSPGDPIREVERRWFEAVARRHTHRGAFSEEAITPGLAVRLQEAAETQGAFLLYVSDPGPRRRILHLARAAERLRGADDEAREETAGWTPAPGSTRRDGVPARAYSPGPPAAGPDELAGRDFDLDRGYGQVERTSQPPASIAVLMTHEDLAVDWLQAGQALQAVLLAAAAEWSFAEVHSRVTEVPNLRAELRRELASAAHPQLMLRFGYAGSSPSTPRRPADDVIDS
jgi:nitroreductase